MAYASTGEAVWYYQYTPHDLYGHDGINESIVADIRRNRHYHPIQVVPYGAGPVGPAPGKYVIWQYEPRR